MRRLPFLKEEGNVLTLLSFCRDWRMASEVASFFDVTYMTAHNWLNRLLEEDLLERRKKPNQWLGKPGYQFRATPMATQRLPESFAPKPREYEDM